ncbi:MAG: HlyD family efflux transporter periplasmic adaptor subunit [Planctomycetota bacterium]
MYRRDGFIKLSILMAGLLFTTVAVGSVWFGGGGVSGGSILEDSALLYEVFEGEFVSSVNEVGDIESSSNVEIRCEVRAPGRSGTTLLDLVPEGTRVRKGDFLGQLDDAQLREEWVERKVRTARDKAIMIQSESKLDAAIRKLKEFEDGMFSQEKAQLVAAITDARENEKRAAEVARHSATLNRKGYVTQTQLQADQFRAKTAGENLRLAEEDLRIYEKFSQPRIISELKAEIRQLEAALEADKYTLELSQQRENFYANQVEKCKITAPMEGTVVYANDSRNRESSIVIEEGMVLREGQSVFYLPDPEKMQVTAKVNDSKINKVEEGQLVDVRVDTAPEKPIKGRVRRVSPYPLPRRYYQAPIEYEVFIDIVEKDPLIRSGLRAKVEIFVERYQDVIQCPVSSLVMHKESYYVICKTSAGYAAKAVAVGSNNEKFAIINEGLEPGDTVLVDADNYRDKVEFPAS